MSSTAETFEILLATRKTRATYTHTQPFRSSKWIGYIMQSDRVVSLSSKFKWISGKSKSVTTITQPQIDKKKHSEFSLENSHFHSFALPFQLRWTDVSHTIHFVQYTSRVKCPSYYFFFLLFIALFSHSGKKTKRILFGYFHCK